LFLPITHRRASGGRLYRTGVDIASGIADLKATAIWSADSDPSLEPEALSA
jgi:hypothetical protein